MTSDNTDARFIPPFRSPGRPPNGADVAVSPPQCSPGDHDETKKVKAVILGRLSAKRNEWLCEARSFPRGSEQRKRGLLRVALLSDIINPLKDAGSAQAIQAVRDLAEAYARHAPKALTPDMRRAMHEAGVAAKAIFEEVNNG